MNGELNVKQTFKQLFKDRCFQFSLSVLKLGSILKQDSNLWILIDQLVRSGTSIGANVVEGGNSVSKREFIKYFQIALKSASETVYWLELLQEMRSDKKEELSRLIKECT